MLEPVSVVVDDRKYIVTPFAPIQAFNYLHELVIAKAFGRGLANLGRIALAQCVMPDGKRLDDKATFEEHFAKHPADMLELETLAMDALCAPWEGKKAGEKNSGKPEKA